MRRRGSLRKPAGRPKTFGSSEVSAAGVVPERTPKGNPFEGVWRIVETEVWDREALDCVAPAHLAFEPDGLGEIALIAIGAGVDYRVGSRDGLPCVEFSWSGASERDPICGRGWAVLKGGRLEGRLFIHQGDDSSFRAERRGADS